MIIGIVAIARNYAIGKDGKLPWHYSSDLKFFKETTTGNAVVMGSNTWRSIGKPLPNRLNIVLSRSNDLNLPAGVLRLRDPNEVVAVSKYLKGDLFIIGGAKTFEAFVDYIERWIVTEIPVVVEDADIFLSRELLNSFDIITEKQLPESLMVGFFERKQNG